MKQNLMCVIIFILATINLFGQPNINTNNCNLPVGTIITSLIDFNAFCLDVGDRPSIQWNAKDSKWAPADGREVNDSKYRQYTGRNRLPDLRGKFLRGLNEFDPIYPTPVDSTKRDPEINRRPASFQPQGTKMKNFYHTNKQAFYGTLNPPFGLLYSDTGPIIVGDVETRPINIAVYYYIKIN